MSTQIGEVSINLRLSLAQFSRDVKDGTEGARTATKEMASTMGDQTRQAKASMALLGEEIGVTIPRHLRTFIAEIPGVGTALSAAFNSIAVLALIELIVKVIEKVQEWKKHCEEVGQASQAMGSESANAFHKLDEEVLSLQVRLDELRGNHFAKVRDEIALLNAQTLDKLSGEFGKIGVKVDDLFKKMTVTGFTGAMEDMLGLGDNKAVESVKAQFDGLLQFIDSVKNRNGDTKEIYDQITSQLFIVNSYLKDESKLTDTNAEALRAERTALESLLTIYTKVNVIEKDKEAVKGLEDRKKMLDESEKLAAKLAEDLRKVNDFLEKAPANGRTHGLRLGPGEIDKGPMVGAPQDTTKEQMPVYGGTKEAQELLKVQTDQNEAIKEAQKIFTQTRTPAEQYREQLAILDTLLKQGKIDQETFNRAVTEAQEKMNGTKKAYADLGKAIGDNINQALLMGRSWTDALKAIILQVAELILKLTLLKALGMDGNSPGGGGFMGSLIKGLTGARAGGGSVYAGSSYLVGEQGPEVFSPGASGFITPGGFGGGDTHYNIDARGSTDPAATAMAVRRAIQESRAQAVSQAVTTMNEQAKRRR